MAVRSVGEGGVLHEPAGNSGWRLTFERFSWVWFVIICWCAILLGVLTFWWIRRSWRRRRARKMMKHLGTTTYPPSSGQEFNNTCPICISDFAQEEEVVLLPCGHTYKPNCLRKQLEAGYVQCAVCRANLE